MRENAGLVNYHTHTWRCQHAEGTEEEFVRRALRNGFRVLGFADHTPWPYQSDFVSGMRMRLDQFPDYERTVRGLAKKYEGQIHIPLGMECEAFPEYTEWLRDFKAEHLDYIILGNHYDRTDEGDHRLLTDAGGFYFGRCTRPEEIRRYCDRTIEGMRTGLYDYVAHPDVFLNTYAVFDEECAAVSRALCEAAEALDIPLEYNLLGASRSHPGTQGYPCERFWEIASDYRVRAIIGFDAHTPAQLDVIRLRNKGIATLEKLGIPVLEELKDV